MLGNDGDRSELLDHEYPIYHFLVPKRRRKRETSVNYKYDICIYIK